MGKLVEIEALTLEGYWVLCAFSFSQTTLVIISESSFTCVFIYTIISLIIVHNIYSFTIVLSLLLFVSVQILQKQTQKPAVATGDDQQGLHSRAPSYQAWLILSFVVWPNQSHNYHWQGCFWHEGSIADS